MNSNEILFFALVGLNVLDVYTTMQILKQGGRELNPLMAWLMGKIGPLPAMLALKVPLLVAMGLMLTDVPPWMLLALLALYVFVVANNLRVIWRLS